MIPCNWFCAGDGLGLSVHSIFRTPDENDAAVYHGLDETWTEVSVGHASGSLSSLILVEHVLTLFLQQWDKKIDEIRACPPGESKNDSVFHGIIHSDLPASEKTTKRMQQEAQMLIMGGQDPIG